MKHCTQPMKVAGAKAKKMIGALVMMGHKVTPVGSRCLDGGARHDWATLGAPESDWDYVVCPFTPSDHKVILWELKKNGFSDDGSKVDDSQFTSVSFFDVDGQRINFIVAHDEKFYNEFVGAQEIVNSCKITHKASRVSVFAHVRGTKVLTQEQLDLILSNKVGYATEGLTGYFL